MTARQAGYWTTTALTAFVFVSGGAAYLAKGEMQVRGMAELGYPLYFVTLLGVWKVLGGLALVAPRLPLLKEWAYAGIAFDLIGATVSHAASGHGPVKAAIPLVFLAVAAASWALRPPSRTLAVTPPARPAPGR
jgi:hypothetical protein